MNNPFESALNFWLTPAHRSFCEGGFCFKTKGWKKKMPAFNEGQK
jgi:hypothetical protein